MAAFRNQDLLELLSEAGMAGSDNTLLSEKYKEALAKSRTKQPGLVQGRNMLYSASPLANIASTLESVMGSQEMNSLQEQMAANLRKEQTGRTAIAQRALGGELDPRQAQWAASIMGEGGKQQVGIGQQQAVPQERLFQKAFEEQKRTERLEKTLGNKLEMATMADATKRYLDNPHRTIGNPTVGGFATNQKDGTVRIIPPMANPNTQTKEGVDQKEYDKAQADIIKLSNDIDAATKTRSATGLAAQNIYRSQSAQTLLSGGMVPKQFLEDAAITIARIAGGGGNIGEKMAEELKAKGISADVAGMKAYLTSHPVDVEMQEWIKLLITKLKQEDEAADAFIRQSALKQISRMGRAAKYAPEDLKRVIKQHGYEDYINDDNLTTYAPPEIAHKVGKSTVEKFRAKLAPGERLVFDPSGTPARLKQGENLPTGWWEPK